MKFITLQDYQNAAMTCLHEILIHPHSYKYQSLVIRCIRSFIEFLVRSI